MAGRIKHTPFVCSAEAMKLLASRKGESDLALRDGTFFLIATIGLPEPEVFEPTGFLGVDLGVVNVATTSDGEIMAGRRLNRYRQRHRDLRQKLQKKRTKSAKRALHADHNGSRNVAHRGEAVWKRGAVNRPRTSTR